MSGPCTGLILEGVTGTGKSSVLEALLARADFQAKHGDIYREEVTFGEFMQESRTDPHNTERLETLLTGIEQRRRAFVLERFHHSYDTFSKRWDLYADIERRLKALNCCVVLLTIPESQFEHRSLHRVDMIGTSWVDDFIAFWGSHERALAAIAESQARRRVAVRQGVLPFIELETSAGDWSSYAGAVMKFWNEHE